MADTLTILTDGYLRAGRVSHAMKDASLASRFYASATEGQPKNVIGAIGVAQMQMLKGVSLVIYFQSSHQVPLRRRDTSSNSYPGLTASSP